MRADLRANTPKVGVSKLPNSKGITNAARNSCFPGDHGNVGTKTAKWSAIWWQVMCGHVIIIRNRLIKAQPKSSYVDKYIS